MSAFTIDSHGIGDGARTFVIAEAGVNHNGDLGLALDLVAAAGETGADAVKFQTFDPELLAAPSAPKAEYQAQVTDKSESQLDMLRRLTLDRAAFEAIATRCAEMGILFLSTPFDADSADLLDGLNMCAFKTPSGELTNLPLLAHIAAKGKPLIVSTGMAVMDEIAAALAVIDANGAPARALLHCVSAYPAAPGDINLKAMQTMRDAFGVPVGFSDHSPGIEIPVAAAALGADVIEKHLTLDRNLPGPDHKASIEPAAFSQMVRDIRTVEAALGDGVKAPRPAELEIAAVARRSIVALTDIPAGATLDAGMIGLRRPGTGLEPARLDLVIGARVRHAIPAGTPISDEMIDCG
jgi:N,N'-diacetyllegionaminate synthase